MTLTDRHGPCPVHGTRVRINYLQRYYFANDHGIYHARDINFQNCRSDRVYRDRRHGRCRISYNNNIIHAFPRELWMVGITSFILYIVRSGDFHCLCMGNGHFREYIHKHHDDNIGHIGRHEHLLQSTTTNLMTGSPTITIASGTATFSIAQTGNVGVGDQVAYGSGSVAYISGKLNASDLNWSLATATGTAPANITNATVTSINRAFSSLAGAMASFSNASHLATTSLIGANVILNIPCYYDTGPDTAAVLFDGVIITTGLLNYVNIYTPNNTSTQANFSQRHTGVWSANAYQLTVSGGSRVFNFSSNRDDVRITGLQLGLTTTSTAPEAIRMDAIVDTTGYIVLDSNIITVNALSSSTSGWFIRAFQPPDELHGGGYQQYSLQYGIRFQYGWLCGKCEQHISLQQYGLWDESSFQHWSFRAFVSLKNNIAQNDTQGYIGSLIGLDASSTNNISDHSDAPGLNAKNFAVLNFVSTSTYDFHLAGVDLAARGNGANLTSDPYYAFSDDVDGQTRPSSGAWDIGADQYSLNSSHGNAPVITSFTISTAATSTLVPVVAFTATSTYGGSLEYLITQSASIPSPTSTEWSPTPPRIFSLFRPWRANCLRMGDGFLRKYFECRRGGGNDFSLTVRSRCGCFYRPSCHLLFYGRCTVLPLTPVFGQAFRSEDFVFGIPIPDGELCSQPAQPTTGQTSMPILPQRMRAGAIFFIRLA